MITPKPKTVVELFEGHPERWTKGAFGRKPNGDGVWTTEKDGEECSCFCLAGAIKFVYSLDKGVELWGKVVATIQYPESTLLRNKTIDRWNDAPERTFEEVLAKAKELNI